MQPPRTSLRQSLRNALRSLARFSRRVCGATQPLPQRRRRLVPPDALVIGTIADPELDMFLMGVRGTLTLPELRALESELRAFERDTILHLDVTDAEFPDPAAYAEFEKLIESLEYRRVRVRIVGLRPQVSSQPD